MDEMQIMKEFEEASAILRGHFLLSSGLHSDTYIQCARVLMNPARAERLCHALAERVRDQVRQRIDLVVAPAMGGVVVGYEMGRQLGVEAIFCERENGQFTLRRGFEIFRDANILLVEDVVTTGRSSIETVDCIKEHGGKVIAEACLIDRSAGQAILPFPLVSLLRLKVATFAPENLPERLKKIVAVKPGSRPMGDN
jgi:orotate phosphoribosyltransferase